MQQASRLQAAREYTWHVTRHVMSCQARFLHFLTLLLRALRSPHYKRLRWIILTIPVSMLVSCFKSSRPRPRLYPHHHLYSQILRKVTNYYWEQISAPSLHLEIYEIPPWLWRVTQVDCSDGILLRGLRVRGKDKARSERKKLSQFSPLSSLLLPDCSPMKISAVS